MSRGGRHQQPIPPDRTRPQPGEWDLIDNTFNALVDYARVPTDVAAMLRNKEAMRRVEDIPLLTDRAKLLVRDTQDLTKDLVEIRQSHHSRKGAPTSPDDRMAALDTHSKYVEWAERFEQVVYPTYMRITEQIGEAVGMDIKPSPTTLSVFKDMGESDVK